MKCFLPALWVIVLVLFVLLPSSLHCDPYVNRFLAPSLEQQPYSLLASFTDSSITVKPNDYTISMFVYFTELPDADTIVPLYSTAYSSATVTSAGLVLTLGPSSSHDVYTVSLEQNMQFNKWTHVVVTHDASGMRLRLIPLISADSILSTTTNRLKELSQPGAVIDWINIGASEQQLTANKGGATPKALSFLIDDVQLFKGSLSLESSSSLDKSAYDLTPIRSLTNNEIVPFPPLVLFLSFDRDINDISGRAAIVRQDSITNIGQVVASYKGLPPRSVTNIQSAHERIGPFQTTTSTFNTTIRGQACVSDHISGDLTKASNLDCENVLSARMSKVATVNTNFVDPALFQFQPDSVTCALSTQPNDSFDRTCNFNFATITPFVYSYQQRTTQVLQALDLAQIVFIEERKASSTDDMIEVVVLDIDVENR